MPIGPTNCTIEVTFVLDRITENGRDKVIEETHEYKASLQSDWLQVGRTGLAPTSTTSVDPNQHGGLRGKEKITLAITDPMPYRITVDSRIKVIPDLEILSDKNYRVYAIPIVPDTLGPQEYILWLGEVK